MASASATNPDTLVTLKVNVEGTNRRFKLPLRDLGASTLPDKVRDPSIVPPIIIELRDEAPSLT
jgi:next-to-BRCA1 protein 1